MKPKVAAQEDQSRTISEFTRSFLSSGSLSELFNGERPKVSLESSDQRTDILIFSAFRFVLYMGSLRASDRLHRLLLRSILRAPLRFFDTQALGRLLNRFGKDIEGVGTSFFRHASFFISLTNLPSSDSQLPDTWGRTLMYGLGVLTTLTVVASVAPAFLVGFFVLSFAYAHYAKLFSQTARELRRLDSVSKSPLYSICECPMFPSFL